MRNDLLEGLVDRHEFARQLGVSSRTLLNWHKRGFGPRRRYLGGRIFYAQADIDVFVQEFRGTSAVA